MSGAAGTDHSPDEECGAVRYELALRGRAVRQRLLRVAVAIAGARLEPTSPGPSLRSSLRDPLTGLPRREHAVSRCEDALAAHPVNVALMLLDLDEFARVNEWLGHEAGDGALREIAETLRRCVPSKWLVARAGGDAFAILVESPEPEEATRRLASRIAEAFARPVLGGLSGVRLTASIGVAFGSIGGGKAESLMTDAATALRAAKRRGRGAYSVYDPGERQRATAGLSTECDLHSALARGELRLHFQPIVNIGSGGGVVGAEALVRWDHPVRGLLRPDEFIAVAEESGLIVPLGEWVVEEACSQIARWRGAGDGLPTFHLTVNLSARQLADGDIVGTTRRALLATGVPPSALCFEVTETALIGDLAAATQTLGALSSLGVAIALDDFGTGYSSLGLLKRFPRIDILKIDRSFVSGVGVHEGDELIVGAIVGLAEGMRATVVAEGVETAEQADRLRALGVGLGQGYLWARPRPAASTAPWATSPRRRATAGGCTSVSG